MTLWIAGAYGSVLGATWTVVREGIGDIREVYSGEVVYAEELMKLGL